jgi:hypothetical protein
MPTIDKFTGVLGVIGGVFALYKGGYDFWNQLHASPRVELTAKGSPLEMTYDPTDQKLEFAFNLAMDNIGTADEFITGGTATLARLGSTPEQFMSSRNPDITFSNNQVEVPLPMTVDKGNSRSLRCVVTSPGAVKIEPSTDQSRLQIILNGKQKAYDVHFCLYLTDELVSQLFTAGTKQTRTLRYPDCGGSQ